MRNKCYHKRVGKRLRMIRQSNNDGMTWKQGVVIVDQCLDCGAAVKNNSERLVMNGEKVNDSKKINTRFMEVFERKMSTFGLDFTKREDEDLGQFYRSRETYIAYTCFLAGYDVRNDKQKSIEGNGYDPSELKFYAVYDGKRVDDGDYWLPKEVENHFQLIASPSTCYPVKVSSAGIHYKMKLAEIDTINHGGQTFYATWESECVHCAGVTLFLIN